VTYKPPPSPKTTVTMSEESLRQLREIRDEMGVSLDEAIGYLVGLYHAPEPEGAPATAYEPGRGLFTLSYANGTIDASLTYELTEAREATQDGVETLLDLLAWMFADQSTMRFGSRRRLKASLPKPQRKHTWTDAHRENVAREKRERVWTPEMRARLGEAIRSGKEKAKLLREKANASE